MFINMLGYGYGKLDYVDPFGRSPLMYCVLADRLDCAKLLLRHGSSVNLKDNFGYSSLHWAAYKVLFLSAVFVESRLISIYVLLCIC